LTFKIHREINYPASPKVTRNGRENYRNLSQKETDLPSRQQCTRKTSYDKTGEGRQRNVSAHSSDTLRQQQQQQQQQESKIVSQDKM